MDSAGLTIGASFANLSVGEGVAGAQAALAAILSTTSLHVQNGSASGIVHSDGTNAFVTRISGGNLEWLNLAGGGTVNLPNGSRINGAQISSGASDSGGAGFRLLRIPN